jgi:hypothetical protein
MSCAWREVDTLGVLSFLLYRGRASPLLEFAPKAASAPRHTAPRLPCHAPLGQVVNGIFGWAIPGPWKRRVRESWERAFGVAYLRKAPSDDSGSGGLHAELAPGPVAEGRSGQPGADDPAAAAAGGSGQEGRRGDEGFEGPDEFDEACTVRLSMADASEPPTARVSTLDDGAPGPAAAAGRGPGGGAGPGEVRQRTPDSATGLLAPAPQYSEAEAGAEGGVGRLRRWGREALGLVRRGGTRRHDEWRRAHERLVTGMGVEVRVPGALRRVSPGWGGGAGGQYDSRGTAVRAGAAAACRISAHSTVP